MKALIDADILVYSCGFASDANAKELGIEAEPVEHCLQGVKQTIQSLCEATDATEYVLYLSGRTNFRLQVDPTYKANRKDAPKPFHYNAIREYMEKNHPHDISVDEEADDVLGRVQSGAEPSTTVIISKDKDLNMIRGWHYNWSKKNKEQGMYFTTVPDGIKLFYKQVIQGDSTDNISGVYRLFGKKATKGLLEPIDSMITEQEMYNYVLEVAYEGQRALMHKQAELIWIRTTETWQQHCKRMRFYGV